MRYGLGLIFVLLCSWVSLNAVAQEWVYTTGANRDAVIRVNIETGDSEFIDFVHPSSDRYTTPVDIAIRPSDGAMFIVNNSPASDAGLSQFYGDGRLPELIISSDLYRGATLRTLFFTPDDRLFMVDAFRDLYEVFIEERRLERLGVFVSEATSISLDLADFGLYGIEWPDQRVVRLGQNGTVIENIDYDSSSSVGTITAMLVTLDGRLIVASFTQFFEVDRESGSLTELFTLQSGIWPQGIAVRLPHQPSGLLNQTVPVPALETWGLLLLILSIVLIPVLTIPKMKR